MSDAPINERYSDTGVLGYVYQGRPVEQQHLHQELLFNMWKQENLINIIVPLRREIAELKAEIRKDRAAHIDSLMGSASKLSKTRADLQADIRFAEEMSRLDELEAEMELAKLAFGMRKEFISGLQTVASDVRSYSG